jgi:UDP-hydrolysing UDP-N-acetyl-D-glucosamine 2-epimerase
MRNIGVLTASRSEYGILRSVLKEIANDPELNLQLFVGGSHLSPNFGNTVDQIEYPITERIECLMSSDTPEGIGKSIGLTSLGFAQAFARTRPDILLVHGDRYEVLAVLLAAMPYKIPIVHLGGGNLSYGAFDENIRHAITKMSHVHLCYAQDQANRVVQMGEDPRMVFVTGNPAIDSLKETCSEYIIEGALVVIFHPVTLEYERTDEYVDNLLSALRNCKRPIVFILPNSDTGYHHIIKKMCSFHDARVYSNLEPSKYYDLLRHATAMIGNSSSGLMEAPTFELPVVNIGTRQGGRLRGKNVIDVGYSTQEIREGIYKATLPEFKKSLQGIINPYGDGRSAPRIVKILKNISPEIEKRFHELPIDNR